MTLCHEPALLLHNANHGWYMRIWVIKLSYISFNYSNIAADLILAMRNIQSGNTKFGSKSMIFEPCDPKIWWMTLKNNGAPLLSNIKLCASFHPHMRFQTEVTVWKRIDGVLTSVALTFDFWPWPFAWTSRSSMVITPENFMIIQWQKKVSQTDRQTDRSVLGAAGRS